MTKFSLLIAGACLGLASCTTKILPPFSTQKWFVDSYSGNAVSNSGLELSFGSEWMITDSTLMQSHCDLAVFPKLSEHLVDGIAQFPEIEVDSILFYNPHRGLLFTTYHQVRPLKPTSEIYLYDETTGAYSIEYARLFGRQYTAIDDSGWENGPTNSVYTNVHYRPKEKRIVLLQRIPYNGHNIAVFQICRTIPKGGKWRENYPAGTFWNTDLGDTDNIERIANMLHSSRNLAVENLKLSLAKQEYTYNGYIMNAFLTNTLLFLTAFSAVDMSLIEI